MPGQHVWSAPGKKVELLSQPRQSERRVGGKTAHGRLSDQVVSGVQIASLLWKAVSCSGVIIRTSEKKTYERFADR